ncbi:glutamine--fructose-6-phosphate aminotransferase[isomerizing] [Striga asiatica]|uniref:Glutamine--fructose-6-phosphate aminotransferase[isomerizing] n=1 Tax=Striga asiatica TaxID=4170 RepID=A0A5A7Q2T2_STRAF|nr:glutamine--fructose-6-phosphate aminotransferase[isomerizing] [Striga asiatica]
MRIQIHTRAQMKHPRQWRRSTSTQNPDRAYASRDRGRLYRSLSTIRTFTDPYPYLIERDPDPDLYPGIKIQSMKWNLTIPIWLSPLQHRAPRPASLPVPTSDPDFDVFLEVMLRDFSHAYGPTGCSIVSPISLRCRRSKGITVILHKYTHLRIETLFQMIGTQHLKYFTLPLPSKSRIHTHRW